MKENTELIEYQPKFNRFQDLMRFRVREILLVSSFYDAYVLEQDGRLSEKIFGEYLNHDLRFVPRISSVSSAGKALEKIRVNQYDLIITMTRISDMNPFEFGKRAKKIRPGIPVIMLTYEFMTPDFLAKARKSKTVNKIFYWLGDARILLSIIKYVEDLKNVERDVQQGVPVILMVEDSPRFYSIYLPQVYTELMTQTRILIDDSINDLHRLLRMRARPKVITAETYEQATRMAGKYRDYLLGIISDISFPRRETIDPQAGFRLARKIKSEIPDLPFLLQSSREQNRIQAQKLGIDFISKKSENLLGELHRYIMDKFGFGDFVFRRSDMTEIDRARNLFEFARKIEKIPDDCLLYHARRNHISIWLRARTEFEMAEKIRHKTVDDFKNVKDLKRYIKQSLGAVIERNRSGVISDFFSSQIEMESNMVMIGQGSMGGKARGIAFLSTVLEKSGLKREFSEIQIDVPKSFVVCSKVFEEFVHKNDLMGFALAEQKRDRISQTFLKAALPGQIVEELSLLLDRLHYPLAVRSSSILEDSQTLPFAGLYSTFMLPNNSGKKKKRLTQLCDAIKLIYASVFYRSPREYLRHTNYRIEEEKMAVIIQEVSGARFNHHFYPLVSGVIQSHNFYPISYQKNEEGIVELALGLGRTIVEGERTYRFSPRYPQMNPPFANAEDWIRNTQTHFYALNLGNPEVQVSSDEHFSLDRLDLKTAEAEGNLEMLASTYVVANDEIRDTLYDRGPRILTFAPLLKYNRFPLSPLVNRMIEIGKTAMGCDVNIEFTLNIFPGQTPQFELLQIRPMVSGQEELDSDIGQLDLSGGNVLCRSSNSMGNGIFENIRDILYVDPEVYDPAENENIREEIDQMNELLKKMERRYLLIGFGRWGSSDPWLGVPVQWEQISEAQVIVEANFNQKVVDPSRGSHFFHNLTSLKIGYIHVNDRRGDLINWQWLQEEPKNASLKHVRHIRLKRPLSIRLIGKSRQGIILYPVK